MFLKNTVDIITIVVQSFGQFSTSDMPFVFIKIVFCFAGSAAFQIGSQVDMSAGILGIITQMTQKTKRSTRDDLFHNVPSKRKSCACLRTKKLCGLCEQELKFLGEEFVREEICSGSVV